MPSLAPPIELIDGEKLISMFQELELGLRPVTIYEIDERFFEEFGSSGESNRSLKPTPKNKA